MIKGEKTAQGWVSKSHDYINALSQSQSSSLTSHAWVRPSGTHGSKSPWLAPTYTWIYRPMGGRERGLMRGGGDGGQGSAPSREFPYIRLIHKNRRVGEELAKFIPFYYAWTEGHLFVKVC